MSVQITRLHGELEDTKKRLQAVEHHNSRLEQAKKEKEKKLENAESALSVSGFFLPDSRTHFAILLMVYRLRRRNMQHNLLQLNRRDKKLRNVIKRD